MKPAKHIAKEAVKPIPETCRSVRHDEIPELCSSNFVEARTCKDQQGLGVWSLGLQNNHFKTETSHIFLGKSGREILFYKMHLDSFGECFFGEAFFCFHL